MYLGQDAPAVAAPVSPDDMQAHLERYRQTIHNLALSIQAEQQATNRPEIINAFRVQIKQLQAIVQQLVSQVDATEMPSGFMLTLQSISDDLTSGLGKAASALPKLAGGIGVGLVAVAALVALVYLPKPKRSAA
jgi:hypothetical protein